MVLALGWMQHWQREPAVTLAAPLGGGWDGGTLGGPCDPWALNAQTIIALITTTEAGSDACIINSCPLSHFQSIALLELQMGCQML